MVCFNHRLYLLTATNRMTENVRTESGWQFYLASPYLAGLFYGTGFDNRGEENAHAWPAVNAEKGQVDLYGFPKDIFYYLKALRGTGPLKHIIPH